MIETIDEFGPATVPGLRLRKTLAGTGAMVAAYALAVDPLRIDDTFVSLFFAVRTGGVLASLTVVALAVVGWHALPRIAADRRVALGTLALSAVLGATYAVGLSLRIFDDVSGVVGSPSRALSGLAITVGVAWLVAIVVGPVLFWSVRTTPTDHPIRPTRRFPPVIRVLSKLDGQPWRETVMAIGLMVAPRIVALGVYYPGVLTTDSGMQINMVLDREAFTSHHPVVHTLTMYPFVRLGDALGHLQVGIASFLAFQVLASSLVVVYVLRRLKAWGVPIEVRLLLLAFYALLPVNVMFGISAWKDIPFSFAVLLYVVMLIDLIRSPRMTLLSWRWVAWFSVVAIVVALMRNNGPFLLYGAAIAIIIILRKYWRRALVIAVLPVVVAMAGQASLESAFDIQPGSIREALSIPLQQFARVAQKAPGSLTEEQSAYLEELFGGRSIQQVGDLYTSVISDPVKGVAEDQVLTRGLGEFLRHWVDVGLENPRVFVDAFLAGNYGYWSPDSQYWVVATAVTDRVAELDPRLNDVSVGVPEAAPATTQRVVAQMILNPRNVPALGALWSIGFYAWLLLFALVAARVQGRGRETALAAVPLAVLWLTCLASPVFAEFRYMYGVVLAVPVLLALVFTPATSLQRMD